MKKLLAVLMMVLMAGCAGLSLKGGDDYVCFAHRYPEIAQQYQLLPIGGELCLPDGQCFKVIGEIEHPNGMAWLQIVDYKNESEGVKFDGNGDFLLGIVMDPQGRIGYQGFPIEALEEILSAVEDEFGITMIIHYDCAEG